jgi:choline dehydrogenase-like flavoprotein
MIPPVYLRGYTGDDPLDRLPPVRRYGLAMAVNAVLTALLVVLITPVWQLVQFIGPWFAGVEIATFALVVAPGVMAFRKSSSLLHYASVLVPLYALDLYLESHVRALGIRALWDYTPGTFITHISPIPLRFFVTLSVDAVLVGPVCLWLSRLLAPWLTAQGAEMQGETVVDELPFPEAWQEEPVRRPRRDAGFWILRLLGLAYLGYLALLLLGGLGISAWPEPVRMLLEMTYVNPYLAVNTAGKIILMVGLALVGAYNYRLRWAATLGLGVGHVVSVAASLGFAYIAAPGAPYRSFLLTSAAVDGAMVLAFVWILGRARRDSLVHATEVLPASFSLPTMLWRYVLLGVAGYAGAVVGIALLGRFKLLGWQGVQALFAYPDPTLGNTLTLYATLAVLSVLMARHQQARDSFTGVVLGALGLTGLLGLVCLAAGEVVVTWPDGARLPIQLYVLLHSLECALLIGVLYTIQSMYYNVEYAITTFRAASARAIVSLHDALFPTRERADVVQAIDRYAANIRGRKRGLVNFPFWLIDVVLAPLCGLHPAFAAMSEEEQKYFLRTYLIRPERERRRAFSPELAEVAFQLGVAAQSVVLFAAYGSLARQQHIGYVPPGARARLQADTPSGPPPSQGVAPLPRDEHDPANWRVAPGTLARPIPAPRVGTPMHEVPVPDVVDYLVVGSGPGGAVAAYRLACAVPGASIAVLERGPRHAPQQDFNERELEMIAKLYKEGGLQQTKRADMVILQGECVGGGSVVNNAVCYRMPDVVQHTWEKQYGLDLQDLPVEYERIGTELGIGPLPDVGINRVVRAAFEQAVQAFNASGAPGLSPVTVAQVNAPGAIGDGLWNLGNAHFGKRSVLETYIPWAEARGVTFVPGCTAVRIAWSGRRAESVLVHALGGDVSRVRVRQALVVAGGVIASSHLLMRSGVRLPVGQRLSCNFALPVALDLGRVVDAFDGEQITLGTRDAENRAIFETYFNPPGAFALTLPFYFDRHAAVMQRYRSLVDFGALVGSEPNGRLQRRADLLRGQAFTWHLGPQDQDNIRYALGTILELARHAAARSVIVPTRPGVELVPDPDNIRQFNAILASRALRMQDVVINTAHPQGGNLMAGDDSPHRDKRVVDGSFRVAGFDNLYVADASIFPTSVTVNPQWTIMAMSSLAAARLLAAHG